ncbi:kelch domain-containing protein 10 homolog [Sitodiplosis mosellana]|uniref:kelch domain-containing protein 10 homolog n=1 Tax=Sitodiplosis mosellana TaxID=263140 RepID=UPI002443CB9A|nr:kelch domain-containing protein 10 homolog [Sitodiplosis mosellana]XP_055316111.1 kelch domain-containing protein 10 homolog [Sitodiplosis mosellana]XP_055316112.1 kelch domain-containing protein 10 homolog [Sitodiplosis mosellana]
MYEFRPFLVTRCEYKSYAKATSIGRGINYIPKPRSGHRVVANETDLFSFGGYNPNIENKLLPELLKFNFLTQKWSIVFSSKSSNMPQESVSNALTLKDNCLVLYGGTGFPFGEKRSNETYLMWPYEQLRAIEHLVTQGNKPEQLYGQSILIRGYYLYVLGGTSGHEFTCDIHRLNLNTRTWESLYVSNENIRDNDPKGRYRHEIAQDDEYIYIFGGGTQDTSFDMEVIPAYNFLKNEFVFIPTNADPSFGYPEARRFHSCVQQGGEVIIAGGSKAVGIYFDDIWKFNLRTRQWKLLQTKLPYVLFFHDAAAVGNGLMYIFGGVTTRNGDLVRTNDLHKIWVQIPKLSEICWEALTFYDPTIANRSKKALLEIGVPRTFAERATHGRNTGAD